MEKEPGSTLRFIDLFLKESAFGPLNEIKLTPARGFTRLLF
jgi:hypothetical protein